MRIRWENVTMLRRKKLQRKKFWHTQTLLITSLNLFFVGQTTKNHQNDYELAFYLWNRQKLKALEIIPKLKDRRLSWALVCRFLNSKTEFRAEFAAEFKVEEDAEAQRFGWRLATARSGWSRSLRSRLKSSVENHLQISFGNRLGTVWEPFGTSLLNRLQIACKSPANRFQ